MGFGTGSDKGTRRCMWVSCQLRIKGEACDNAQSRSAWEAILRSIYLQPFIKLVAFIHPNRPAHCRIKDGHIV
jgi:hypothetical protein